MKVIDLLNKIATGEEVPEKIKFMGCTYYLCRNDQSGQCYFSEKQGFGGVGLSFNTSTMNEEVEIIEEDKKIEKLFTGGYDTISDTTLANKINEIIDYINEGVDKK